MKMRLKNWCWRVSAALALLATWELLGARFATVALMIATPSRVFQFCAREHSLVLQNSGYTLLVSFAGFIAAGAIGIALAVACFRMARLSNYTVRFLQAVQVVPILVFAPFITVVLGIGPLAHVFIAFLVGLFPFVTLVLDALIRIPMALGDLVRLYGIGFRPAVTNIYLPFISPAIFAAARVSATVCVVATTVAEFTGSRYGLGKSVFEAAIRIEPEKMVVSTCGIVLIGIFYISAIRVFERRVVKWRH